jgi:hypothetical protein
LLNLIDKGSLFWVLRLFLGVSMVAVRSHAAADGGSDWGQKQEVGQV